jgi:hypothetical protein
LVPHESQTIFINASIQGDQAATLHEEFHEATT